MASRDAVEILNAAFFVHGLGERDRPRALSGAPRARLVEEATGLRPHLLQISPRGRVFPLGNLFVCGADCQHGSGVPWLQPRGGDDRLRSSGSDQQRHSRLESVAELGTSFDGGWCGLAGCHRISKCRTFRAERILSISQRVRMSEREQWARRLR